MTERIHFTLTGFPKDFGKATLKKRVKCWLGLHPPLGHDRGLVIGRHRKWSGFEYAGWSRAEGGERLYLCDDCNSKVLLRVPLDDLPKGDNTPPSYLVERLKANA